QKVSNMNQTMFEPVYNMGTIYVQEKRYTQAEDSLIKAAQMKPDDAFVMNNLGIAYEGDSKLERAAFAYGKASDLKQDNPVFAKNAGFAYLRLRKPDQALPYLERAHRVDANDKNVSIALADAYTRVNRKADAGKLYTSLQPAMGDNPAYWFN